MLAESMLSLVLGGPADPPAAPGDPWRRRLLDPLRGLHPLTVPAWCQRLGCGRTWLWKQCRERLGEPPHEILACRLWARFDALRALGASWAEAALALEYADAPTLQRAWIARFRDCERTAHGLAGSPRGTLPSAR